MQEKIHLKLLTPHRALLEGSFDMVVIPGFEGELGVLYNHVPIVVALKAGIVKLYMDGVMLEEQYLVSAGLAHISSDACIVLVDHAHHLRDSIESIEIDAASNVDLLTRKYHERFIAYQAFALYYKDVIGRKLR